MVSLADHLEADSVAQLWVMYHDYSGLAHAKSVPRERFSAVVTSGVGFAKANMDFNILDHQVPRPAFGAETGDFFAVPDPTTYAPLPYHPGAARVYAHLTLADGVRWAGCPRSALETVVAQYAEEGWRVRVAFEPECYLLRRNPAGAGYAPADQTRMFAAEGLDHHWTVLARLTDALRTMGVTLEQVGAEYGPGQYEINVRHAAPLQAADDLLTLKEVLRALTRAEGLLASFMPKPYTALPGCGLHVHLGLEDADGRNVLDGDGPAGLGDRGRAFVGGLLAHAPALCGVGAPTVNSYQRLLPGSWSPAHMCYGPGNRAALVRVPDGGSRHVEFRAGDNTCNPHLFLASLLAAGLDGIRRDLEPGAPALDDVGHLSDADAAARGMGFLPRTATQALDAVEADATIMEALGPVIGPAFLRVKRSEVAAHALVVSDWERAAYLETT